MGEHEFKMVVTLNDFSKFDYFIKIERTIKLKINSICETTVIYPPDPVIKSIEWHTLVQTNLLWREFDEINDSVSKLGMDAHGLAWPAEPFFCGKREYTFTIEKF